MTTWRVEVGYVGMDRVWHWGVYARGSKSLARVVFNKFKTRERTRLFKDGALVCEVNGPEVISDPDAWKDFQT